MAGHAGNGPAVERPQLVDVAKVRAEGAADETAHPGDEYARHTTMSQKGGRTRTAMADLRRGSPTGEVYAVPGRDATAVIAIYACASASG
jgi:hypothetical protein